MPENISSADINEKPNTEGLQKRIDLITAQGKSTQNISSTRLADDLKDFKGNIENYIGMAQVPIGLAGPLLIQGTDISGEFLIPLATTEGALVASYNRGMKACRLSGGITARSLAEGIKRSPFFKFKNLKSAVDFTNWITKHKEKFDDIVANNSRYARLKSIKTNIEGNGVILILEYTTGDASGQNMVTICTDKVCKFILSEYDVTPEEWYIESNYSGDKKATMLSFTNVRGKKVTAEIEIPSSIVDKILKTTPKKIVDYWQSSTLAVIQSGAIGAQGHLANGLTALFIACGQDVACISESSIGVTRMEVTSAGGLYVTVTLPSLMVGTVGGGTGLPTQKECLSLMDCYGAEKVHQFAEICCAVALAGEVSIAAAIAADHFTRAHQLLGRSHE